MKYLIPSYRISLLMLLVSLLTCSCTKEGATPTTFTFIENPKDKVWDAKAAGDTITFKFASPVKVEKININNVMEWVTYDLKSDQLTLYIRPNSGISVRSGSLGVVSLEKGEVQSLEVIKLTQRSLSNSVKEKILYTYYPLSGRSFSSSKAENKVLKLIIPADATETSFSNILKSNLSKEDIMLKVEYPDGDETGWIESTEFIMVDGELNGIKVKTKPIPSNIEQRKVTIRIQDKEFSDVQAQLECIQIKDPIKVANPEDIITEVPLRPAPYSVLLNTDIPKDQIKLEIKQLIFDASPFDIYRHKDESLIAKRVMDPIYINNYLLDDASSLTEWELAHPFMLNETSEGLKVEGMTTTAVSFFGKRWDRQEVVRKLILISNKVNDNKMALVLEDKNLKNQYILFEDGTKEKTIHLSSEAGSIGLSVLTNSSDVLLALPSWIKRAYYSWRGSVDYTFPERVTLKREGLIYRSNPFRTPRTVNVSIDYQSSVYDEDRTSLPNYSEYLMSPLVLTFVQEGFTGDYIFKVDPRTPINDEPKVLSSGSNTQTYSLMTNLVESQIKITKTALAGWIDYQLKVQQDPDTGFVSGIIFSIDPNETGKDREVTYTLEGPEGEGLTPIIFKFKQSK